MVSAGISSSRKTWVLISTHLSHQVPWGSRHCDQQLVETDDHGFDLQIPLSFVKTGVLEDVRLRRRWVFGSVSGSLTPFSLSSTFYIVAQNLLVSKASPLVRRPSRTQIYGGPSSGIWSTTMIVHKNVKLIMTTEPPTKWNLYLNTCLHWLVICSWSEEW